MHLLNESPDNFEMVILLIHMVAGERVYDDVLCLEDLFIKKAHDHAEKKHFCDWNGCIS